MLYKYGKGARDVFRRYFYFSLVFPIFGALTIKTITLLAFVGYQVITANMVLRALLAIYHLL